MPSAKKVGYAAFADCKQLERVEIPAAKRVGGSAFAGCIQLKHVDLQTVSRINEYENPFHDFTKDDLSSLVIISMPALKGIPSNLFSHTSSLKVVDISGAKRIGYGAFTDCKSLMQVDMSSARRIGEHAFFNCSSLDAVVPIGARYSPSAFDGCQSVRWLGSEADLVGKASLWEGRLIRYSGDDKMVSLPNSVDSVGEEVFARNANLEYVDAPGVKEIGERTFQECKCLERISMPSVMRIDERAFYGCSSLEAVVPVKTHCRPNAFDGCRSVRRYDSSADVDGDFSLWRGRLIRYTGSSEEVALPRSVTSVGESVFYDHFWLKGIKALSVRRVEEDAFRGCGSLKRVDMPAARTIGKRAFCGCTSMERLKLPVVKVVSREAFNRSYWSSDEMIPHTPPPLSVIAMVMVGMVLSIYEIVVILMELLG